MTNQQYFSIRLLIAIVLITAINLGINAHMIYVAPIALLIAMFLLIILKRQIKEVIADERDYNISGTAARYAMFIYTITALTLGLILTALPTPSAEQTAIGTTLMYSGSALLIIHSLAFHWINRYSSHK